MNDGAANSTAATSTVNVTWINDALIVSVGGTASDVEQGTPAVLDFGVVVIDDDNLQLASATVPIT